MDIFDMIGLTIVCIYFSAFSLSKRESGLPDGVDLALGIAWIIAALVGWIIYLAIKLATK